MYMTHEWGEAHRRVSFVRSSSTCAVTDHGECEVSTAAHTAFGRTGAEGAYDAHLREHVLGHVGDGGDGEWVVRLEREELEGPRRCCHRRRRPRD